MLLLEMLLSLLLLVLPLSAPLPAGDDIELDEADAEALGHERHHQRTLQEGDGDNAAP